MAGGYDMCVDYDTLRTIETRLRKVEHNLKNSTEKMRGAIRRSQDFLTGNQFEKAKNTTMRCLEITRKTEQNIRHARDYIRKLMSSLEEYGRCGYLGEG